MKTVSVLYFPLRIALRADERDALLRLSANERRGPSAQAALLIRESLERRRLLTADAHEPARNADAAENETQHAGANN